MIAVSTYVKERIASTHCSFGFVGFDALAFKVSIAILLKG